MFFVVTDDFLTGAPYAFPDYPSSIDDIGNRLQRLRNYQTTSHLDIKDCSKAYGSTTLISKWGDALALTTAPSTNNFLLSIGYSDLNSKLICPNSTQDVICEGGFMQYQTFNQSGSFNTPISHCLAERARQRCRIRFSIGLIGGVIACNILKIICMGYMVWRLDLRPLVTIGDALASFLESPGQSTGVLDRYVRCADHSIRNLDSLLL